MSEEHKGRYDIAHGGFQVFVIFIDANI